jgi:hypothetical protein
MVTSLTTSVQALIDYNVTTAISSTTLITTTAISSTAATTVTSSASHSIAIRAASAEDFIDIDELLRPATPEMLDLAHEPPTPEQRKASKRRK